MKNVKKGFTLVELLFVMAIIAILAGFAIANLKDSTKVATENSLKNDVRNAITQQQTYFASNQEYDTLTGATVDTAKGTSVSVAGTQFTFSKGNVLASEPITCTDNSLGYEVSVSNTGIAKEVTFDSCTDGTISTVHAMP